MKFDLFDAIEHMKSKIGDSSEILVFTNHLGYCVRLTYSGGRKLLSNQFIVSYRDLNDTDVDAMNLSFHAALQELAEAMHPTPAGE